MSLLLDALKKAAQDKQKSSAVDEAVHEPEANDVSDDELELELHLDEQEQETQGEIEDTGLLIEDGHKAIQAQDDFDADLPELNEPIVHQEAEPPAPLPEPVLSQPADEVKAEPMQQVQPESPGKDDVPRAESIPESIDEPKLPDNQPIENNQPGTSRIPPELPTPKPHPSVNTSREVLDMMIRKSCSATERRHRLIRNLGVVVFLLLLLAGGSYFYYDSEQQIASLKRNNNQLTQQLQASPEPSAELPMEIQLQKPESAPVQQSPVQASVESPAPRQLQSQQPIKKPATKASPEKVIQISSRTVEDPVHVLLTRAYNEFNAGQYDSAHALYARVLNREQNNRDAILGTAAVAMKQQRYDIARQRYIRLLELDPKDSLARAGLSAIKTDANSESGIKFMLREQPDAAHLHFALGAIYAEQQRWPEAQQAFFNAWTGAPQNADYAYNLAISLDQLGKYKQASNIYQASLKLARGRQIEFSAEDVQARIDQLGRIDHE